MLRKGHIYSQMVNLNVPNILKSPKLSQIVSNDPKLSKMCKIVPCGPTWSQIVPNDPKWY